MELCTRTVHAGRTIDPATGAVTTPIHRPTTFERSPEATYPRGFEYARQQNPNRRALEQCLADLEGGSEALCFASGLAVAQAIFASLEASDHILLSDDLYYGVRRLLREVFARSGFTVAYADFTSVDCVRRRLRAETRLLWIETPYNPLRKITGRAAFTRPGQARNIRTVGDSTFASPCGQQPLALGIDLVMHSTTKYLAGHSDVTGGAPVTRHPSYLFERARGVQQLGGAVPSPFDCWLTLRGIATLALRYGAQSTNAQQLAESLAVHPRVAPVADSGLPAQSGHELAWRPMSAFGGMLPVRGNETEAETLAVAPCSRQSRRATSLGGVHSLIERQASIAGPQSATPRNLLRISTGIEDVRDLWADLAQALA